MWGLFYKLFENQNTAANKISSIAEIFDFYFPAVLLQTAYSLELPKKKIRRTQQHIYLSLFKNESHTFFLVTVNNYFIHQFFHYKRTMLKLITKKLKNKSICICLLNTGIFNLILLLLGFVHQLYELATFRCPSTIIIIYITIISKEYSWTY